METYTTLSFKTEKQVNKNLNQINSYFKSRLISSEILKGVDERGNYGFYVKYNLSNKMKAKKYFDKEYGNNHIKDVVDLKDIESLYGLIQEYADEQLRLYSLPTKKYVIDFDRNVLARLEITNNEPTVIDAIDGWGDGISKNDITITEK